MSEFSLLFFLFPPSFRLWFLVLTVDVGVGSKGLE